jgi:uncharacterized protein YcfJ
MSRTLIKSQTASGKFNAVTLTLVTTLIASVFGQTHAQQVYSQPPQQQMQVQPAAGDVAVVIARQPNFVTIQQRQCEQREVVTQSSGAGGGLLGAVAGGLIGSTLGGNSRDRNAGAAVGMVGGALLGNEMSKSPAQAEMREVCRVVPVTVQQGETITFNYQGRVFTHSF